MKATSYQSYVNKRLVTLVLLVIISSELLLYFIFSTYGSRVSEEKSLLYQEEIEKNLAQKITLEMQAFEGKLTLIEDIVGFLELDHTELFSRPIERFAPLDQSAYEVHENGTLQSINQSGASIYYPLFRYPDQPYWERIRRLKGMENAFMYITDSIPLVEQVYFNSQDTMNIIYPGIPNASEVFGNKIDVSDFIFYYLADQRHNPDRLIKWTPVYADPAGAGWVLSCIVPIYLGDQLEGVTGIDVRVEKLTGNLTVLNFDFPYAVMILNDENNIISYYDEMALLDTQKIEAFTYANPMENEVFLSDIHSSSSVLGQAQYEALSSIFLERPPAGDLISFEKKLNGVNYTVFKSTLTTLGWSFIFMAATEDLVAPIEAINKSYETYTIFANLLMVFISFALLFIAYLAAKKMTNNIVIPLNELTRQSANYTIGHQDPITLETPIKEINSLRDTLNSLQHKINSSIEQMVKIEREKEKEEAKNSLLRELSYKDMLTRLNNRRKMEEVLDEEIARGNRYGTPFSVLLLDIDFFKRVNDQYGHDVGDEVLVAFSRILEENLRETDVVGRWGGEEFMVILRETNLEEAFILAEKLRVLLAKSPLLLGDPITVSIGLTELDQNLDDKYTLYKRVDEALYEAKSNGRNQTVSTEATHE